MIFPAAIYLAPARIRKGSDAAQLHPEKGI
jgi:hypothetical protein